jgi:hypothetical protein
MCNPDFDLQKWNNLGNRLLRRKAISQNDLRRALRKQEQLKAQGNEVKLGEILIADGCVDKKTVDEEVEAQQAFVPSQRPKSTEALRRLGEAVTKAAQTSTTLAAFVDC